MNEKVIEEVKKIDLQVMKKAANFEKVQKMSKKEIADIFNERLRKLGLPEIDKRTYLEKLEDGEVVEKPQTHKGVIITNIERKRDRKIKTLELLIEKKEKLLNDKQRLIGSDGNKLPINTTEIKSSRDTNTEINTGREERNENTRNKSNVRKGNREDFSRDR